MDVLLVRDILLVYNVGVDSFLRILTSQDIGEGFLEIFAKSAEKLAGVFSKKQELPLMSLRHGVTLEAILVPALLLTHLTVPAELLQPFGLDLVREPLRCSYFSFFTHFV